MTEAMLRRGERVLTRYPCQATGRPGTVTSVSHFSEHHAERPRGISLVEVAPDALNVGIADAREWFTMPYAPDWVMRLALVREMP